MISLIVYALAMLAQICWIVGWCLVHAYLTLSQFFHAQTRKRMT
jgi:hypothetical protein